MHCPSSPSVCPSQPLSASAALCLVSVSLSVHLRLSPELSASGSPHQHLSITPARHPSPPPAGLGLISVLLSSLSLPTPTQPLPSSVCPHLRLSQASWHQESLPHTPPRGLLLMGSQVGSHRLVCVYVCMCALCRVLSHVPSSSNAGTQSNSVKGHTHPLLFPKSVPSSSQQTSASPAPGLLI